MHLKTLFISVLAAALIHSFSHAETLSARSTAMGGVGVASSRFAQASLHNPALLVSEHDTLTGVLPNVGLEASDRFEVIETLDSLSELFTDFETAVNPATFNLNDAQQIQSDIINGLESIDEKPVTAHASGAISVSKTHRPFNWSIGRRVRSFAAATLNYASSDIDILNQSIISQDSSLVDDIESFAQASYFQVTELTASLAWDFRENGRGFSLGVTPKAVNVVRYFYAQAANAVDLDEVQSDELRRSSNGTNVDVGIAYFANKHLTWGVMFKDLFHRDYHTQTINGQFETYEQSLSVTAGVSADYEYHQVALDIDLRPEKALVGVDDSQFIRAGGEFNVKDYIQFRAGLKIDVQGERDNVISAGFGVAPYKKYQLNVSSWSSDIWNGDNKTQGALIEFSLIL